MLAPSIILATFSSRLTFGVVRMSTPSGLRTRLISRSATSGSLVRCSMISQKRTTSKWSSSKRKVSALDVEECDERQARLGHLSGRAIEVLDGLLQLVGLRGPEVVGERELEVGELSKQHRREVGIRTELEGAALEVAGEVPRAHEAPEVAAGVPAQLLRGAVGDADRLEEPPQLRLARRRRGARPTARAAG